MKYSINQFIASRSTALAGRRIIYKPITIITILRLEILTQVKNETIVNFHFFSGTYIGSPG